MLKCCRTCVCMCECVCCYSTGRCLISRRCSRRPRVALPPLSIVKHTPLACFFSMRMKSTENQRFQMLSRTLRTFSVVVGMRATPIRRSGYRATNRAISSFAILHAFLRRSMHATHRGGQCRPWVKIYSGWPEGYLSLAHKEALARCI